MFEKDKLNIIKELVAHDEIESALNILFQISNEINDKEIKNRILLHCSSYRNNNKHMLLNAVRDKEDLIIRNKSIMAILQILDDLEPSIKEKNYSDYRGNIINKFKKWKNRFVHLNGKENFEEIALFARETDWEFIDQEFNKNEYRERKEGTIENIRKDLLLENQFRMMIIGEAGMGKSTTMQYLVYKDAIDEKRPIPVYVELKLLISELTIQDYIIDKYFFSMTDLIEHLHAGTITLFLDGLNEILPTNRQRIYINIKNIFDDFPKTFIMMSSRQQYNKNDFENVPVFALQKMDVNQIQEFIKKNTDDEHSQQIILDAISRNVKWRKILGTPLILFMLINIVKNELAIPDDESKIILQFINNLLIRERTKDINFEVDYFNLIISYLAFESIELKGDTNSGIAYSEVDLILRSKFTDLSIWDVMQYLKKAIDLSILTNDGNVYSFFHQSYQQTLAGAYFNLMTL